MTARNTVARKDKDWARIVAEVEAAMRELPLASWPAEDKKGKRFRIPSSHDVREPIIAHLAEKYPDMYDAPDPPPARKDVQAQFATLVKRARALREGVISLGGNHSRHACAALQTEIGDKHWPPVTLLRELDALIDAAGRAEVPTAKSQKGPAEEAQAKKIAQAAWPDYQQLTGKPLSATRDTGGGFPAFLDKIFKALDVTASPENLAKAVDRPSRGEAARTKSNADLDRILQDVAAPVDHSIKNKIASPRSWASLIKMK
jgi:hypothetical protein